jgi:hypothetical protein
VAPVLALPVAVSELVVPELVSAALAWGLEVQV